jgi:hypothetical protein
MLTYRKVNTVKDTGYLSTKRDDFLNKNERFYSETISITRGVYENRSIITQV